MKLPFKIFLNFLIYVDSLIFQQMIKLKNCKTLNEFKIIAILSKGKFIGVIIIYLPS